MKPLIWFALVATAFASDINVLYDPYDYCEPTTSSLIGAKTGLEVRVAGARSVAGFVSGSYSGTFDFTEGHTLYLFPDGRAKLAKWCDICPTELAAEGKWKIDGAVVHINWRKWHVHARDQKFFTDMHGACENLRLYLGFEDKFARSVFLISTDKEGPKVDHPFVQRSSYEDWKAVADGLERKKG